MKIKMSKVQFFQLAPFNSRVGIRLGVAKVDHNATHLTLNKGCHYSDLWSNERAKILKVDSWQSQVDCSSLLNCTS